ncbi:hybrid sensor histidine kinase/response regulator [Falsiroseomonas oryziterrae]|uniref:hybrid sensor histidine kinase/response regulator n=1 Tax=Falsiroseomonas oryziterrae TaxID=2911368 RepID=UPI001F3E277C|nr:hybrid sensor histidine kinase/response regulator [Roseomonas sp. NPKOSM-4]
MAAFALLATVLFVRVMLADRESTLADAHQGVANAAALLAERADRTLRVAELTASRVADLVARYGAEELAERLVGDLVALDAASPEVGSLWVLDASGRVVASSLTPPPPRLDVSDRDYVRALLDGEADTITALMRSRPEGLWFFAWARAVRVDGRLVGIVTAALHGEDFGAFARRLGLDPGAELSLYRRDGTPVMHWPLPAAQPVPNAAVRTAKEGMTEEQGADGAARLVAWRAASVMPVIAEASLPRTVALAPFQTRLLQGSLLFVLGMAIAGWLAVAGLAAERREAEARWAAEERGTALETLLRERLGLLASLQEREARLRLAQQAGGLGLWDLDIESGRLSLDGEVFEAWGAPGAAGTAPGTTTGRAALRAIHPADRRRVMATVALSWRSGAPLDTEFRLGTGEAERWIGVRAEARGHVRPTERLLGIALDVTGRRQAQQSLQDAKLGLERRVAERTGALAQANARLREGEARFRGLFNATFQFIGLLSPDGTVLEANAAMLRLGGVRAAEVTGRPYWAAPWWPDEPEVHALLRGAVSDGAAGRFVRRETEMLDVSGRRLMVDFSVTPVRDEDGLVSLLVAEARDISSLKAAQALLHEAQKMDTLGQLTGGVAHDFNNLLMAVLGNLALARKRALQSAPELMRHLDAATQAAERGATLTQRLLAFARRQDLKPRAVELRGLLAGLDALLRRSAGPLVNVEVSVPEDLPPAHVDPLALELALVNLAVNARDAMPDGGQLSVRAALVEGAGPSGLGEGRWLTIAVSDTGAGMDAATLTRAVEPFFTTKGPGHGTGLGLSMVHGLAAQSGGQLLLESAPGRGTTATIWLPASALVPEVTAAPSWEVPAGCGRGAVLVVDDEELVLESTAAMLQELGYEPLPAESGEAALALLSTNPGIVAVLTDHAMPGMTGLMLAERVRAERPDLPVILATGHAGAWADAPGAPPRLMKPYGLGELAAALRGVLAEAA